MKRFNHPCTESVFRTDFYSSRCQKEGVVERDGKWYCTVHDPEYKKAKQVAWQKKFDAEYLARQQVYRRNFAMRKACAPFTTEELETGEFQINKEGEK